MGPGNIKKTSGPDPDPSPWLEVKDHMKEKSKAKPYDPKKQVWVPNANKEEGGYFEGKAAMAKLENKVHELEAELAGTQARTGESAKAYQRAERKCKELVFSSGEDKKNQDRMTDLASKLQSKIKTYKQQIEEAEEIAALNLAKFRKAQQELEEVEERAKLAALI